MAQNQEQIEAKLAAYIDGELDEAGCAEIRKHLAGNPQHRKLVEDLIQTRDLVRGLPRQSAPSEISEAIQSQLERSVLLGGGSDYAAESTLRISRWPHPWAIAAILLLTAGLGVLVYKVLPSNKPPAEFAIAPKETGPVPATLTTPDQPSPVFKDDALARGPSEMADKSATVQPALAPAPGRDFEVAAVPGGVSVAPSTQGLPSAPDINGALVFDAFRTASNSNGAVNSPLANGMKAADAKADQLAARDANEGQSAQTQGQPPISSPRSLYLVVSTSDPEAAKGQLRTYLASNQISYEPPLSESTELKTDEAVAQANRLRQEEARLNVAPALADFSKVNEGSPSTVPTIALGPAAGPATQPLASAMPAPGAAADTNSGLFGGGGATARRGGGRGGRGGAAPGGAGGGGGFGGGGFTGPGAAGGGAGGRGRGGGGRRGGAWTQPSSTQPDSTIQEAQVTAPPPGSAAPMAVTAPPAAPPTVADFKEIVLTAAPQVAIPDQSLLYCKEITRQQATELSTVLSGRIGQTAQLYEFPPSPALWMWSAMPFGMLPQGMELSLTPPLPAGQSLNSVQQQGGAMPQQQGSAMPQQQTVASGISPSQQLQQPRGQLAPGIPPMELQQQVQAVPVDQRVNLIIVLRRESIIPPLPQQAVPDLLPAQKARIP